MSDAKKFAVSGTMTIYFNVPVEAETEEEAERIVKEEYDYSTLVDFADGPPDIDVEYAEALDGDEKDEEQE